MIQGQVNDLLRKQNINTLCSLLVIFINLIGNANGREKNDSMIYILMWTTSGLSPFVYIDMGQKFFQKHQCEYQNCYITDDGNFFYDMTLFDVVLYNVVNVTDASTPNQRSKKQKYVFVSDEPPVFYPVPEFYNGFFNLTWTYRLNSDATLRYVIVKNTTGDVIGPKTDMHWIDVKEMKPISKKVKRKLRHKRKAVAWFVSHCETPSKREDIAQDLAVELANYELQVDTYGKCGELKCSKSFSDECFAMLEADYYFYLAFENSMADDYVTEKLLIPLQHYVVPVVYGGANYSRFLPNGSYLDATKLNASQLAKKIYQVIKNTTEYYNFFKWHRHYRFQSSKENGEEVCNFCALLNKRRYGSSSVYNSITDYWY